MGYDGVCWGGQSVVRWGGVNQDVVRQDGVLWNRVRHNIHL